MNQSPALAWTNPPAGTMSFALVFTDIFNPQSPFLHSVMFDIPATVTELPANVEKAYAPTNVPGAHQTLGYNGSTRGYLGPCPQNGNHIYEFAIYALPTATLAGATMTTSLMSAATMIKANNLGVAKLTGTHQAQ
ncbi:MAG: YbhB/YbcL family Raf kinase inhibitor-like protein [Kofleriaceae bacterium]